MSFPQLRGEFPSYTQSGAGPDVVAQLRGINVVTITGGWFAAPNLKQTIVALSGASTTAAVGNVGVTRGEALAGQGATGQAGTLSLAATVVGVVGEAAAAVAGGVTVLADNTRSLDGAVATAGDGTVAPQVTVALTGAQAASQPGTVGPGHANALTGEALASASGIVVLAAHVGLVGASVQFDLLGVIYNDTTVSAGSVGLVASSGFVAIGTDKTSALAGQALLASAGTTGPQAAVGVIGQALTSAAGTVALGAGLIVLTGTSATSAPGTLGRALSVAVSGQAATASSGTVSGAQSWQAALTGEPLAANAGTLVLGVRSMALTGTSATGTPGSPALVLRVDALGLALAASLGTVGVTNDGTVALMGLDVVATAGTVDPEGGIEVIVPGDRVTATLYVRQRVLQTTER